MSKWDVSLPGIKEWINVSDLEEVATGVKFTLASGTKVTIRRGNSALILWERPKADEAPANRGQQNVN